MIALSTNRLACFQAFFAGQKADGCHAWPSTSSPPSTGTMKSLTIEPVVDGDENDGFIEDKRTFNNFIPGIAGRVPGFKGATIYPL